MAIKLEVGKTYVNKRGEEVSIVGTSPYDNGYQIFVGMDKNEESSTYYKDGEYYNGGGYCDLITEHKEPVVYEAWVVWCTRDDREVWAVTYDRDITKTKHIINDSVLCKHNPTKVLKIEKITYTEEV